MGTNSTHETPANKVIESPNEDESCYNIRLCYFVLSVMLSVCTFLELQGFRRQNTSGQ